MKKLIELFVTFAKIGVMTFGGGLAMLPMLTREVVNNKKWATEEELLDYYAIGQCTPGIIAVNTATFIGYNEAGVAGGIVATMGVIFPSIVIILLIASVLSRFMEEAVVIHALNGIRAVVCALLLKTVIGLGKKSLTDKVCVAICLIAFGLAAFTPVSTVLLVVLAAAAGILLKGRKEAA